MPVICRLLFVLACLGFASPALARATRPDLLILVSLDALQMAALFIAEGPDFRKGRSMPVFDNVDVQPLMARLLHLSAPKSDGTAKVFDRVLLAH